RGAGRAGRERHAAAAFARRDRPLLADAGQPGRLRALEERARIRLVGSSDAADLGVESASLQRTRVELALSPGRPRLRAVAQALRLDRRADGGAAGLPRRGAPAA